MEEGRVEVEGGAGRGRLCGGSDGRGRDETVCVRARVCLKGGKELRHASKMIVAKSWV